MENNYRPSTFPLAARRRAIARQPGRTGLGSLSIVSQTQLPNRPTSQWNTSIVSVMSM